MSTADSKAFPRVPLLGAGLLILTAFGLALGARVYDVGTARLSYSIPAETRALRFEDRADGSIAVSTPATARWSS